MIMWMTAWTICLLDVVCSNNQSTHAFVTPSTVGCVTRTAPSQHMVWMWALHLCGARLWWPWTPAPSLTLPLA